MKFIIVINIHKSRAKQRENVQNIAALLSRITKQDGPRRWTFQVAEAKGCVTSLW